MRSVTVALSLILLGPFTAAAAPIAPFFYVIPFLPGGSVLSQVFTLSPDGSTAVGRSSSEAGFEATRWTEAEGLVSLGDLPGGGSLPGGDEVEAFALAASAQGSVIAGLGTSDSGIEAFRWTQAGGMVGLGDLPGGGFLSEIYDMTPDGNLMVGRGTSAAGREALYWTEATGLVSIGDLPGGDVRAIALGVSADGSVIVGDGSVAAGQEAFRWTQSTGFVPLGELPGGAYGSRAWSISPDGSVIVGTSQVAGGAMAWRWTEAEGMVPLGDLPGGGVSSAGRAVSANGEVIVGQGSLTDNDFGDTATYWLEDGQIRRMDELLEAWGLDLGGMTLSNVGAVSDDGLIFAGSGWLPGATDAYARAWVAGVPSFTPSAPEPGVLTLIGVGLAAIGLARRRAR